MIKVVDESKECISKFLSEYSINEILEVYLQDNCYSEIVEHITDHINTKLARLSKIEEVIKSQ